MRHEVIAELVDDRLGHRRHEHLLDEVAKRGWPERRVHGVDRCGRAAVQQHPERCRVESESRRQSPDVGTLWRSGRRLVIHGVAAGKRIAWRTALVGVVRRRADGQDLQTVSGAVRLQQIGQCLPAVRSICGTHTDDNELVDAVRERGLDRHADRKPLALRLFDVDHPPHVVVHVEVGLNVVRRQQHVGLLDVRRWRRPDDDTFGEGSAPLHEHALAATVADRHELIGQAGRAWRTRPRGVPCGHVRKVRLGVECGALR